VNELQEEEANGKKSEHSGNDRLDVVHHLLDLWVTRLLTLVETEDIVPRI